MKFTTQSRRSNPEPGKLLTLRRRCLLPWLSLMLLASCAVRQPVVEQEVHSAPVMATAAGPIADIPAAPAPAKRPPSPEKGAALHDWVSMQERVYRVAAPLLINNTEMCPRHVRNLLGLTAKTRYSYSDEFSPEAENVLGLDDKLRVMSILPGSGASLAGVHSGDVLLAVEIEPLPQGREAERTAATIVSSEMQGRSDLHLTIGRDGDRMSLDIPLTSACAMAIEVGDTDRVNSYADGRRILVTRGMLHFVRNDEELAYVLAKEIAHNLLTPYAREDMGAVIDRLRELGLPAPVPGIDAGIKPYSPVLDATADKLALYLLARAGYNIGNFIPFWERLAEAYPAEIADCHTALHPSSNYRFSVMKEIVQVIAAKRRRHLPLIP